VVANTVKKQILTDQEVIHREPPCGDACRYLVLSPSSIP
jgi:hypothetical protein